MAGETILIIDADEAVEQKIMTVLEAKGYLVFIAASQVLNAETIQKLGPSLIFIATVKPGAAGLETCKSIHGDPNLKQVPMVLLGSRGGSHHLQDPASYGIVDFLPLTFGPDELIKKTETILGRTPPSHLQKGNGWGVEKVSPSPWIIPSADESELDPQFSEWEAIDRALSEKYKRIAVSEPWNDMKEDQEERLEDEPEDEPDKPLWPETAEGEERKRSALLGLIIDAAIIVAIAGAVLLVYKQFRPTPNVWPVRPATTPSPAPPKPHDTQPESQLPPDKIAGGAPNPASQVSEAQATTSAVPASTVSASPKPASPAPGAPAPSAGLPQAPSLPARSTPQPPVGPFYAVQIGAYKNEDDAQRFANKFLGKGYDAFVQAGVTKDKSPIYRVLVSKSEDREAAIKLAEEIRSKEGIETTVFVD